MRTNNAASSAVRFLTQSNVFNENDLNKKYEIKYNDILKLDECGLINSGGLISLTINIETEPDILLDFKKYVLVCKCTDCDSKQISFGGFPLTQAGKELLSIARLEEYTDAYINDIVALMQKHANGCEMSIHKVISRDDDDIDYEIQETTLSDKIG